MKWFLTAVPQLGKALNVIAGTALTVMMLLTVADVILRKLGHPIIGSYELVSLGAAVVIGFSLPFTSLAKAHVAVDFLLLGLRGWKRGALLVATRVIALLLFAAIGAYLFKKGMYMRSTGEVSLTLQMPFYPVAYGLGVCCFVECLVLLWDILKIAEGQYE